MAQPAKNTICLWYDGGAERNQTQALASWRIRRASAGESRTGLGCSYEPWGAWSLRRAW